ncbi:hypothetical protein ILUMI_13538 [Ignelater luminosus]|uniref:Serine protease K12H4.7 n=1 Tax=Ignelater luminosus TaxID=2038154 RepID=A0A8K0G5Q4_IGNLU|nr:hypothetical protein ILUMI_13538 [Ignelater luminosus]
MKFLMLLLFVFKLHIDGIFGFKKLTNQNIKIKEDKASHATEEWFTQILDHFNPIDPRTWKQRFQTNHQYYNASNGGSVFLFIGTESPIELKIITESAWFDYAKKFGALCFQLEHRYYGKSFPTKDIDDDNMRYLTTQQALADLAQFISEMNKRYKLPADTKWIAFGCSYGANLAAWLRLKYPHLVYGAVCSNAILTAKIDYGEYYEIVSEVLQAYSEECLNAIQKGTSLFNKILLSESGKKEINKKFHLCDPLEQTTYNSKDISNLYHQLARNFAYAVQFYNTNCFGYYDISNIKVDLLCNIMKNKTVGSTLDRLAAVNNMVLFESDENCLEYKYNKMIKSLRNGTIKINQSSDRLWVYQRCTEIVNFPTSSSPPHIFGNGFPVDFYTQQCMDVFGPKFNATFIQSVVDKTNMFYGGFNLKITRAVFIFGSVDPWHPLQIPKTLKSVVYIKGVAHCADMFARSDKDSEELKAAREQISKYISEWLKT